MFLCTAASRIASRSTYWLAPPLGSTQAKVNRRRGLVKVDLRNNLARLLRKRSERLLWAGHRQLGLWRIGTRMRPK